jgi:nucleotide-binding universal stress UspA family protein
MEANRHLRANRIVIDVDGSAESAEAVHWVAENVDPPTEIVAVAALEPVGEFFLGLPPSDLVDWRDDVSQALRSTWCAPLTRAGLRVRYRLEDMTPWRALMHVAREEEADLIVVGRAHHGLLHGLMGGDDADHLVHHARRPILVVPAPAGDRHHAGSSR